jgi:hypothetical protein
MSNYPLGAEHDSNAPFNREELKGETIGVLEEILCTGELTTETTLLLIEYQTNIYKAMAILKNIPEAKEALKLLVEPQIFIENE